ncbi:metal-dependent hydrolase [Alkalinema pantanalense CENA528]|uniref:metal-dependent hydrolase n=1 Tax=Alkalinema pantanalense TaxID=1620705 RepID=UPI003D6DE8BA
MMSITHATIAAAGATLILGTADPLVLGLAVLGSQLPDLDTTTSTIGQICFPIASWIENRYPHRTITHCLLATAALTAASLSIGYVLGGKWTEAIALPLGHLLACFSDTFTKQGVMLFYPYPAWAISVSNPRRRLRTGGAAELWVLAIAAIALAVGIYLATGGGITAQVNQTLGLKDGMVELYNQTAASRQVYADVLGVWQSDRTRADGRYVVLANEGNDFYLWQNGGIYRTGQQLITERLTLTPGTPATTRTLALTLDDEDLVSRLGMLLAEYPNALVLLSGQITIDSPELLTALTTDPRQFPTIERNAKAIKLTYHPLELSIAQLKDQYATGTITVKVMSPKP